MRMKDLHIGGSIRPLGLGEDDWNIGDNRKLYIRSSSLRNDCVEVQFDNGPRVHIPSNILAELITRCS